ncbi:MAG: hypothetical protein C4617_03295 [Candidatus Liberibacter europaeus]|uniref:Uncharacterized protein n=1 Tax=Candidatus Liberibacter europaeus TaxID=744859 RepID=A0A2T4VXC9_9HYPH|nr:hypothetical protein [Candidatus Liberibacter europaeus]PTL86439.1 MAG: hypothetical protein C4617_03295 [Candidatus Liberibacter europaeus]
MTNNDLDFEVLTRRVDLEESTLIIRLELNNGLSDDALRHIELEAKEAVKEHLQPLKTTIRNIETKDLNKSSNPDDDVCEACQ